MEQNKTKISILSPEKGKFVAKFDLQIGDGENTRAILILPSGSKVFKHAHDKDSEVYIDFMKIMHALNQEPTLKGYDLKNVLKIAMDHSCPDHIKQWFNNLLADSIKVAGKNSPTGDHEHEIKESKDSQLYLAIKKGPEEKNWVQLQNGNYVQFMNSLNFNCKLIDNELIKMASGLPKAQESVNFYFNEQCVTYKNAAGEPTNVQIDSKKQKLIETGLIINDTKPYADGIEK